VITGRWRVCFTPGAAPRVSGPELPFERRWLEDWGEWLRREDVLPRTPFLASPGCEYDIALNEFFLDGPMAARSPRPLEGYARQLGLANTTFRRNFPDIAADLARQAAERRQTPPPTSRYDQLQETSARLRQENRQLRGQLELAAAVIQRITLENPSGSAKHSKPPRR
jgi:hypothetical protein